MVEKLLLRTAKFLTGFWIMPDTGFSFDDAGFEVSNAMGLDGARVVRHPVKVRVMLNSCLKRLLGLIPYAADCSARCFYLLICCSATRRAADSRTGSRRAGDRAGSSAAGA